MPSRLIVNGVTVLILAATGVVVWRMAGEPSRDEAEFPDLVPKVEPLPREPVAVVVDEPEKPEETDKPVRKVSGDLAGMVAAWERGGGGNEALRVLSGEVVKRFGIGDELVMYLHFLVAAGEYDERLRMMGAEVREMFRGESGVKAREWLLTLSDKRLAEKLAWEVGTAFDGGDFASYFEVVGAKLGHNPQAWLLYGYCVRMAESDLEMALETYQGLGYPKRIDNTGMGAVMAAMPEGSDFARYANWMGEDSKTLAYRARRALLANWAGRDPVAAADFVQSADPVKVFPRQIGTVLNVWLAADGEAALAWVEKSTGAVRAEAMAFVAEKLAEEDPEAGWKWVLRIEDAEIRRVGAIEVLARWAQVDPEAAKEAKRAVFPGA
jgi:hypothetical protein